MRFNFSRESACVKSNINSYTLSKNIHVYGDRGIVYVKFLSLLCSDYHLFVSLSLCLSLSLSLSVQTVQRLENAFYHFTCVFALITPHS